MEPLQIHYTPLQATHFPLLLKWINTDHVARWWRENRRWNLEDVIQKYGTYCKGYKKAGDLTKPIHSFIIEIHSQPIGFIQYYNAHDFPREGGPLPPDLPTKLAALDLFIGETDFIGKGLGPVIIHKFLKDSVEPEFEACFVDPHHTNTKAIHVYEKVGFQKLNRAALGNDIWMVKFFI